MTYFTMPRPKAQITSPREAIQPHPEPSLEDIARGQAFAVWLKAGLTAKGWNSKRASDEAGVPPTSLSIYLDGGRDPQTGKIRQPEKPTVKKLAVALSLDENTGLIAAGYRLFLSEERVVIAPGRPVTVLVPSGEKVDMVLSLDAIDVMVAFETVRKRREDVARMLADK